MQNKKALLISVVVALFAVGLIYSYITNKENSLIGNYTPFTVVVAVKDIPEGTRIDDTMVQEMMVPKKFIQPGAAGAIADVLDKVITIPVLSGTQLLEFTLVTTDKTGISSKINKGMRAFSIAVTDVTAAAGLVQPGDYIDVLATVNVADEVITKTILQNILVLAANQTSSRTAFIPSDNDSTESGGNVFARVRNSAEKGEDITTLTLSLLPEDVQKIDMAQGIGTLSVSLRSKWDQGEAAYIPDLTSQKLLGISQPVVPRSLPAWIEIRGAEQIRRN